jgi:hypothetical protein
VNETKTAKRQDGLIEKAPDGATFANNFTHGSEPPAMLLAILNSALVSMINSQQARIFGKAVIDGRQVTIIFIYDAEPTPEGLKAKEVKL